MAKAKNPTPTERLAIARAALDVLDTEIECLGACEKLALPEIDAFLELGQRLWKTRITALREAEAQSKRHNQSGSSIVIAKSSQEIARDRRRRAAR
jgi:hypothetical protein